MAAFNLTATGRRKETKNANFHLKGSFQADRGISVAAGLEGMPLVQVEGTITEGSDGTGAAGTYTLSLTIPAGAFLLDVFAQNLVLWTAGTSALMDVGDAADPNGYFAGVNLKATDVLANETISFLGAGGKGGAYYPGSNAWTLRYSASARVITFVVTTVGTAGTAGRTRCGVVYSQPQPSGFVTEATYVAT